MFSLQDGRVFSPIFRNLEENTIYTRKIKKIIKLLREIDRKRI